MKISYYGHSCFLIENNPDSNRDKILFDPFIRGNEFAKHINIKEIKPDFILISHGHSDHIADCVEIAKQSDALCIASWEVISWLGKQGISKTHPMNYGGKKVFDFGTLRCVNADHSTSMPEGSYGGNPLGFIIEFENSTIYFAGDTALHYDMKLIGELWKPDIAFLPLGSNFTMDADDAVIASQFINCKKIIAMHYDTFGYIKINHEEVKKKFSNAGIELLLMEIGEEKKV